MIPIGARLREIRKARGLKLRQLPWAHSYICRIENGTIFPSPDRLAHWCELFSISAQELLASEEEWLLRSPFIREAGEDLLNLTFAQRAQVLEVLRDLSDAG